MLVRAPLLSLITCRPCLRLSVAVIRPDAPCNLPEGTWVGPEPLTRTRNQTLGTARCLLHTRPGHPKSARTMV
ncbi:hypothetical protein BJY01DRAFT_204494, partial [Aspergillus pseudoustus]